MTGFGGVEGGHEGLLVTHLADEHHVGVFTHQVLEGVAEVDHVHVHLTLIDQGLAVGEEVFDGVLDGDDMAGPVGVDVVEGGGDSRGLARPGDTCEQGQSLVELGDLVDALGQVELVEVENVFIDPPGRDAEHPALPENVDAEPVGVADLVGEVGGPAVGELLPLVFVHDLEPEVLDFLGGKRRALDRLEIALDPNVDPGVALEVQVRRFEIDHVAQVLVQPGLAAGFGGLGSLRGFLRGCRLRGFR